MKFRQYVDFPGSKDANYSKFSKETFELSTMSSDPYNSNSAILEVLDGDTLQQLQRIFHPYFTFDPHSEVAVVSGFVWGKKSVKYEQVRYRFYSVESVNKRTHETRFVKAKLNGAIFVKEKK